MLSFSKFLKVLDTSKFWRILEEVDFLKSDIDHFRILQILDELKSSKIKKNLRIF